MASCISAVALFVIAVASICLGGTDAKRLPRWWLDVAQRQGPNACVVEEVPGATREFWTECRYWLNRKICGKKTRIRFECCEGFEQIEGDNGCNLVKPLRNLLETAESLGATKWADYIRESGLQSELESSGAYTLFAPSNDAFDRMRSSLRNQVESYRGNPNNPVILYHMIPSKLRSGDFQGDMSIETRNPGHNIRINKYSNGMTTINCALLTRKDQEATNGLVHIIDEVLDPSKGVSNNIADMVVTDGRFQVLAEMLEKSGYINVLRTFQDSITLLAPSDEAFQKLSDARREKIINDREARLALLQNHVIPHVICESAITGEHRVRTMLDNKLTFNCDIRGAFVENTKMRGQFTLGKNGILHMIDDVLLPDRAKNLVELAESRQLPTFVDFVKRSGLEETLSHTGDYTFFVPEETAWSQMPPEELAHARRDPEYAGLMLRFHGAYGRHMTNAITDNQAIMSLDEEHPVRLQVWRRALGVEDAKITESDIEAQNGVIHIINKVIFPSNKSIEEVLRSIPGERFETFIEALKRVSAQTPPVLSLGPGGEAFYTFFVPSDKAFANLGQADLRSLMGDINKLTRVVKSHIAINMFPATSFEPDLIYSVNGMAGDFSIKKDKFGHLTVNDANVGSSHMSANGVIHIIDEVFPEGDDDYSTSYHKTISSISRQGGTTTYTTHTRKVTGKRHRVTFTEEGDFDDILPGYPQGSVIAGGTPRESHRTDYPYGKDLSSKRRDKESFDAYAKKRKDKKRRNKKKKKGSKVTVTKHVTNITNTIVPVPQSRREESVDHHTLVEESHANEVVTGNRVDTHPQSSYGTESSSRVDSHRVASPVTTTPPPGRGGGDLEETHSSSSTSYIRKGDRWKPSYDREPALTNTTYHSTSIISNITAPNLDISYNENRGGSRTHSKTYTYSYTSKSGPGNLLPNLHVPNLSSDKSYRNYTTISTKRVNSVGPVSPDRRFSYVGHPYGNDVVGHEDGSAPLPFSSPGSSYIAKNSEAEFKEKQGVKEHPGVSTITRRKKIGITETLYSYPRGATSSFTFPIARKVIPSTTTSGKKRSDSFSAYAFTRGEGDFADGTEFAEAAIPPEKVITKEQAKILRRQWRRKRHNLRRRNRRRKGAKRRGQRRMKKAQKKE